MPTKMAVLASLVMGLVTPVALADESVADPGGEWVGVAKTPEMIFELVLEIEREDEEWTGQLKSPWPMSLESVSADDSGVQIVFYNQGRIEGDWEDGGVEGRFSMGGIDEPIRLVPLDSGEGKTLVEETAELRAEHRPEPLEAVREGPAHERIDNEAVEALVAAANEAGSSGLALFYKGELVSEWYAGGEPKPVESMSVTKPILALGVGVLLEEERLDSIDTYVHEIFPEWDEGDHAKVTIRHLLNHSSGLGRAMDNHALNKAEDRVTFALKTDIVTAPGEKTEYNNNAMNLLAGVVGKAAGQPADEYLAEQVFEPLGIEDFEWSRDEAGNPQGQAGLSIRAGDLARLGQLILQEGVWDGERLVDAEFLEKSVRPQSPETPIGLAWFLELDGEQVRAVHHSGDLGQFMLMLPEEELVAVRMVAGSKGYDPASDTMQEFNQLIIESFADWGDD